VAPREGRKAGPPSRQIAPRLLAHRARPAVQLGTRGAAVGAPGRRNPEARREPHRAAGPARGRRHELAARRRAGSRPLPPRPALPAQRRRAHPAAARARPGRRPARRPLLEGHRRDGRQPARPWRGRRSPPWRRSRGPAMSAGCRACSPTSPFPAPATAPAARTPCRGRYPAGPLEVDGPPPDRPVHLGPRRVRSGGVAVGRGEPAPRLFNRWRHRIAGERVRRSSD